MKVKFSLFIVLIFVFCNAFSQNITGTWEGNLDINGNILPIVFHIKKDSTDKLVAVFDSPLQKAFGLPCNDVSTKADSTIISMQMIGGYYAGKFYSKDSLKGMWHQGKGVLPLNLKKTNTSPTFTERKRPQTPKPPFDYLSQDVEFNNSGNTLHYSGTLTKPFAEKVEGSNSFKKFPAVILITGTGRQDRDETIFDHKPFAVIADYLTKKGIAVLRIDDRGMGNSSGNFVTATSADFAKDVEAAINFLKQNKDIDIKKIGLIGHSEGGMIAPMVAARNKDVSFIVMMAGVGVGGRQTNEFQNTLPMQQAGISKENIDKFLLLHRSLVQAALNSSNAKYNEDVKRIYFNWKAKQTQQTLQVLIRGEDSFVVKALQKNYADFRNPWWKFFMSYDPKQDIEKLSIPVLALNGAKDVQVQAAQNLTAINEALKKSKSKNFKTIELPGLNHLFQHCNKCTIEEYGDLEETFAPEVLKIMSDWVLNVVK